MKFKPTEILTHIILILGVLLMVLPIWFSFATSTHDNIEIMTGGMKFLLGENFSQNYNEVLNEKGGWSEEVTAANMFINPDPFKTKDGSEVIQLSGTLDLLNPDGKERTRCRLRSIILPFEKVQVELRMLYAKDDRYGDKIEARIIESLEVLKEL